MKEIQACLQNCVQKLLYWEHRDLQTFSIHYNYFQQFKELYKAITKEKFHQSFDEKLRDSIWYFRALIPFLEDNVEEQVIDLCKRIESFRSRNLIESALFLEIERDMLIIYSRKGLEASDMFLSESVPVLLEAVEIKTLNALL